MPACLSMHRACSTLHIDSVCTCACHETAAGSQRRGLQPVAHQACLQNACPFQEHKVAEELGIWERKFPPLAGPRSVVA